jgi:hypothetical protein
MTFPPLIPTPHPSKRYINPAGRRIILPSRKMNEIISSHTGKKHHLGRRIAFVEIKIEIYADLDYGYDFEEVQCKGVWLRAVGLPELLR